MWDISAAGHVEAGHGALETAQRELQEEIGLALPPEARN
jgi:ADP-ribose pyrophosphatase YjhB (NUDIX family)